MSRRSVSDVMHLSDELNITYDDVANLDADTVYRMFYPDKYAVPELFDPYVVNRTIELSALFQSGIVANNSKFDALASEAARTT